MCQKCNIRFDFEGNMYEKSLFKTFTCPDFPVRHKGYRSTCQKTPPIIQDQRCLKGKRSSCTYLWYGFCNL